jgi:predicted RNA-binding protein YlxR (DUF448 family)
VACGQKRPKRELERIVRTPQGQVVADPSGKLPGRGAYVCRSLPCWEKALKGDKLAHALKATVVPQDRQQLLAHAGRAFEPAVEEAL